MSEERDEHADRAAILARRRHFIVLALGGLACREAVAPSGSAPPEDHEVSSYEPARTGPAELAPPSLDELRAILLDPNTDVCAWPEMLGDQLRDEEKIELAQLLYEHGVRYQDAGDHACATAVFERAYYLVPGKHGLAFMTGVAAAASGDCLKAVVYLEHWLDYADLERHPERHEQATLLLSSPELRDCPRPEPSEPAREVAGPDVCLMVDPRPRPTPESRETDRQRRERERAERRARRARARASKMFDPH